MRKSEDKQNITKGMKSFYPDILVAERINFVAVFVCFAVVLNESHYISHYNLGKMVSIDKKMARKSALTIFALTTSSITTGAN